MGTQGYRTGTRGGATHLRVSNRYFSKHVYGNSREHDGFFCEYAYENYGSVMELLSGCGIVLEIAGAGVWYVCCFVQ